MDAARALLGDECAQCGSTDRMEFDHIDPADKVAGITELWANWRSLLVELQKCQLLCHGCHWEKTLRERRAKKLKVT
jgi:5-methylcytosine-specific restriction endonuclease McrA